MLWWRLRQIKSKNSLARERAARKLGRSRDLRAFEALLLAIADGSSSVRAKAAEALGRIADPRAIETLVVALADIRYVGRSPAEKALERIDLDWAKSDSAKAAVPSLVAKVSNRDDGVRASAAEALGKIGDSRAMEPLIACLADLSHDVRLEAARALGKIKDSRAIMPLVVALADMAQYRCRPKAFEAHNCSTELRNALKDIDPNWWRSDGAKAAVPSLAAKLTHRISDVRCAAAWALGEIGDPQAVEPLLVALMDNDDNVRWNATTALGKIGDPRAIGPLVADCLLKNSAEDALKRIDPNWINTEGAKSAVPSLVAALTDKDVAVRSKAAEALGKIRDPRAVDPLIAALKVGVIDARTRRVTEEKDAWRLVAEALAEIGDPRAIEPLVAAFTDGRWCVSVDVAAKALWKIGDPRAVEELAGLLQHEQIAVRFAVAKALAEIGDPRTAASLVTLAHEPHYGQESIHALERLLEANDRGISAKDLLVVSNLKNETLVHYNATLWASPDGESCEDLHQSYQERVDCGRVRELAQRELNRRARESDQKRSLYGVGDRLAGRWEVLEVCGGKDRSGMGVVYIVRKLGSDYKEAAKTFQHSPENSEKLGQAIRQEAELWVQLGKHPNIVQASRVEMLGNQLYIFMEYVEPDKNGRNSLSHYIAGEQLPEEQFITWAMQACRAMAHAHSKGLQCHRDIKPDNLLISASGDLKITDFGLAKAYASAAGANTAIPGTGLFTSIGMEVPGLTCTGLLVGTPGYIAPEIVLGESGDIRSDIYSFGLVLYQMITGKPRPPLTAAWRGDLVAYERETLELRKQERFPPLTSRYGEVVAKCLRFSPADRFQDFTALLAELHSLSRPTISLAGRTDLAEMAASADAGPDALSFDDLIHRATSLCNLGKLEEALDCIRQAKEIDSGNKVVWNNEGVILTDLGRREGAMRCFERSIELDPTWAYSWNNKGRAYRDMGRDAEALTCYENATRYDPGDVQPWVNRGNCLRTLGRYQEAVSCYEQAIQIDENWADAWAGKGDALAKLGRLEEAIESLERALKLDPQNSLAQKQYREILGKRKEGYQSHGG